MKTYLILLAAGTGSRFGSKIPKQFLEVGGKMIVEHAINACVLANCADEIIVVTLRGWESRLEEIVQNMKSEKPIRIVTGADSRQESCAKGVAEITDNDAYVIVHNAAQPFVEAKTLKKCIAELHHHVAVTVGNPVAYTVMELNDNRTVRRVVPRMNTVSDMGPECFRASCLRAALKAINQQDTNLTGVVVRAGLGDVYVVDGTNYTVGDKLTWPEDIRLIAKAAGERC